MHIFRNHCSEIKDTIVTDGNKTRSKVKRAKSEIVSAVYRATSDSHDFCHHPDKNKDKLVQDIINYLAKPGVIFSINNACCHVAGKRKDGTCKVTWLYDWAHRHESQIRDSIDIIKGSAV